LGEQQHTHPFNGPFSGTTLVSHYHKGKTNLDFTEASDSEWQWHQLDHMQVCTLLQTGNHTSTPPLWTPGAIPHLGEQQEGGKWKASGDSGCEEWEPTMFGGKSMPVALMLLFRARGQAFGG